MPPVCQPPASVRPQAAGRTADKTYVLDRLLGGVPDHARRYITIGLIITGWSAAVAGLLDGWPLAIGVLALGYVICFFVASSAKGRALKKARQEDSGFDDTGQRMPPKDVADRVAQRLKAMTEED